MSLKLKIELVVPKHVTAFNHLPSSTTINGGLKEKVCNCLFILNSSDPCGRDFACSINVSVCFKLQLTIFYSF